uniref:CRAL-TRIO domain-containing protein n=1 Tax=Pyrodinium bahamense TaxID=73915 RepID=A0A7S0FGZ2_9DINO
MAGGRDKIIAGYVRAQELQAARMAEASARLCRPVTKQVVIMDLQGLSFKPDPRAVAVFRDFLTISARYYPETLAKHFFVNVPLVFMGLWRMIRGWLDPVTAAKMHLLGSNFKEALLQHIEADQLPREYGGTNDLDLLRLEHDCAACEYLFATFEAAANTIRGYAAPAPAALVPAVLGKERQAAHQTTWAVLPAWCANLLLSALLIFLAAGMSRIL